MPKTLISNNLYLLLILILPFMQLGVEYYLSVAFITFCILFLISLITLHPERNIINWVRIGLVLFSIKIFSLMFLSTDTKEIFIVIRELICFVGLIIISNKIAKSSIKYKFLKYALASFLILTLSLTLLQTFLFSSGQYFGFPIDLFVINKETLLGAEMALSQGTRFRPTSFYGEPSYTAWIVLSLLMIISLRNEFSIKFKAAGFAVAIAIAFLSQSLSGILSIVIYTIYYLFRSKQLNNKRMIFLSILLIFSIVVYYTYSTDISLRLFEIFKGSDESTTIRFSNPFTVFQQMINNNNLIGVSNFQKLAIDNALFGLTIHYGIIVIPIFILMFKILEDPALILYLLFTLNFNGTLFGFDKVIVLSLVFGLTQCKIYIKKRRVVRHFSTANKNLLNKA